MWLARDKDGELYLFLEKPTKGEEFWIENIGSTFIQLSSELYLEVK